MAQAREPFMAHFGAALLAAWWLVRDDRLSADTEASVVRQADALIARHSWLFQARPSSPAPDRCSELIDAISDGLDQTWAIGHDVIFTALVVRTAQERPELVTQWVVDGVLAVLTACRALPLETIAGVFDVRGVAASEVDEGEVATDRQVARLALDTMLGFDHVYLGLHQGDIGHIADHAHAVLCLGRLGFEDSARQGLTGLRHHIAAARRIGHMTAELPEVGVPRHNDPSQASYWDQASSLNDWAVGHVFKYPYAVLDLLRVAGRSTREPAVLARLGQLVCASA
jgi:hypothetical protein